MQSIDPQKLLLAAKTSLGMIGVIHDTLWQLFPDELLALNEEDEEKLISALCSALEQKPLLHPHPNRTSFEDIF